MPKTFKLSNLTLLEYFMSRAALKKLTLFCGMWMFQSDMYNASRAKLQRKVKVSRVPVDPPPPPHTCISFFL